MDGRAQEFLREFECIIDSGAARCLSDLPEMEKLTADEMSFAYGLLAAEVFHNASSYDRRVRQAALDFPQILLAMARVRLNLPDPRRKAVASEMLKRAKAGTLDSSSMKILKHFQSDVVAAADSGTIGIKMYTSLRALRRVWRADVRENERLNKGLKLMGQRSPNARLDLISGRTCLKYMLGSVGALQLGLDIKTRKWSQMAPLAESVSDTCLNFWHAAQDVMQQERRWAISEFPEWLPSQQEIQACTPILDPMPAMSVPRLTSFNARAAEASRKVFAFFSQGETEGGVSVQVPQFAAILVIKSQGGKAMWPSESSICNIPVGSRVYFALVIYL